MGRVRREERRLWGEESRGEGDITGRVEKLWGEDCRAKGDYGESRGREWGEKYKERRV